MSSDTNSASTYLEPTRISLLSACVLMIILGGVPLFGCAQTEAEQAKEENVVEFVDGEASDVVEQDIEVGQAEDSAADNSATATSDVAALAAELGIVQDLRPSFDHGPKPAENQKYIVLHDTEGDGSAASTIDWWDSNGNLIASHFIINKDGSIYQAVPIDRIAHHAGYGDTGHNDFYGIVEDGRDDMLGSTPIGSWASDYGMNAWSVGIELVHVGGSGDYPQAQLEALDRLIAYIDASFGVQSAIIDHKDWRTGNSDTSPEFAPYLENYRTTRTHQG